MDVGYYQSPLGKIILTADEEGLTGLWFADGKNLPAGIDGQKESESSEFIPEAKHWLHGYFAGLHTGWIPPLHLVGTPWQQKVWNFLQQIPYGHTITYGDAAVQLVGHVGSCAVSARAVGQAVGANPVSIIVPCHRVVGKSGSLTGYSGGLDRKIALLKLEGVNTSEFFQPEK